MSGSNFFDMRAKLTARPVRPVPPAVPAGEPMTVTQVNRLIDKVVRAGTPPALLVRGEVSNFSHNVQSGHAYFTLKDETDQLNCVMFKDHFDRLKFAPSSGLELVATGNLQVYGRQGRYQLYVSDLQPVGHGALELAFKQLCRKLEAEGLFDPAGRKPIPRYPQRLAIVTSRQTAALKDMLKTVRPVPAVKLFLFHVPVQGDGCGAKIADAVKAINRGHTAVGGIDLILIGRGGGSYEDLWGFNDESLARAIRASKIPVITGIGHDVDVSIADLAADHHAHTPTEAAATAVRHWTKVVELLNGTASRIAGRMRAVMTSAGHELTGIERHELFRRPVDLVNDRRVLIDDRERAIAAAIDRLTHRTSARLQRDADRLARYTPVEQIHRHRDRLDRLLGRLSTQLPRQFRRWFDQLGVSESRLAARHPAGLVRLQLDRLESRQARLDRAIAAVNRRRLELLAHSESRLTAGHPAATIRLQSDRLDAIQNRVDRAMTIAAHRRGDRLTALSQQLEALSPQRILERGYTITTSKKTGQPIRTAAGVKEPDRIVTTFADGSVESVVEDAKRPKLF